MKGKYKFLLLALLIAFASCSFTNKIDGNTSDKDKLLVRLITYLLDQGHFAPQEIDDDFADRVFDTYINQLDPFKRYFYKSDIKEFEEYKTQIDDQIRNYDLSFFDLTYNRVQERIEEAQEIYQKTLDKPYDYTKEETLNVDYETLDFVKSKREMKARWREQLKFSSITNYEDAIENNIALAKSDSDIKIKSKKELEKEAREQTRKSLKELFTYRNERRRIDWFSIFLNSIVKEFDPHTFYFKPTAKEQFDVDMSGKFEGIGARLQRNLDAITIDELISGGPAWRQKKLETGDQILKVRQKGEDTATSIVGMRLEDAVKYIKGPKGTKVILTVKKVDGSIKDIEIKRDVVILEETYAKATKVIKDGKFFGLINLPSFYDNFDKEDRISCAIDVKKEIKRLKKENVEGLILDLRNNRGGSLGAVVDMAGLFIKDGPIVQVKSTTEPKRVLEDADKSIIWDGPLVIMVNELSASASEILAAAMQDYKRAIIIGSEQTFGKGTVQNVVDLNRVVRNNSNGDLGAIKFTTDKYYRINGGSTQLKGVKSDIVVPDRYRYIGIGERTQDNPLKWDKIDSAIYSTWDRSYDYNAVIAKSQARIAENQQFELIDLNAKWINNISDNYTYSLNYENYKKDLKDNEDETKKFEKIADYETDLKFKSLPHELRLMAKDSTFGEKRKRWHTSLSKDAYIEEAINVLNDIKTSNVEKKNMTAQIKN